MQAPVLYTGKTKKNERLLKTKQCSANSLPLQTAASHCFNVTFRFLSLSKHTEQSPESIPQCLSIGKFSVLSDFCSLERRTLLEKQTHRIFYRMISISQTCLYLIKFVVGIIFFNKQKTENMKSEKFHVRRMVQGRRRMWSMLAHT